MLLVGKQHQLGVETRLVAIQSKLELKNFRVYKTRSHANNNR